MSTSYSPRIVTSGLVLLLDAANTKSYPGSGTAWNDLSGEGNNLTNDGATFNTSGFWSFAGDGGNLESQLLNIPLTNGITMCCWWRMTGTGFGSPRIFETLITGGSAPYGHALAVDTDGSLRTWIDENSTTTDRFLTLDDPTTFYDGNWHYLVMTYQDPIGVLYIDGVPTENASISTTGLDDINIITIGAVTDYGGTFTHASNCFQGDIAICQLYNRGLSSNEVLQNYNATKGRYQ